MEIDDDIIIYSVSTRDEADTKWLNKKEEKHKVWKVMFVFYMATFFFNLGVNSTAVTQFYFSPNPSHMQGWSNVISAATRLLTTLVIYHLVNKLGLKYMLFYGTLIHMFYVMANYYPSWPTMVIGALLSGFGGALIDLASMIFMSKIAIYYARNSKRDVYNQLLRSFTCYYVILSFTYLVAQFLSVEALGTRYTTLGPTDNSANECGINYCPSNILSVENVQFDRRTYWIYGFGIVNLLVSAVFFYNLENLKVFRISETEDAGFVVKFGVKTPEFLQKVKRTLHYLFVAVNAFATMGTPFFLLDILKGYVICPFGVKSTTSIISTYTLTYILSAFVLSWMTTSKHRYQLSLGICLKFIIPIVLITTSESFSSVNMMLVLSSLWAVGDGILAPGITAMYTETFANRILLSLVVRQVVSSLALLLVEIFSVVLCMNPKMFVLMNIAIIALLHYPIIELIVRHKNLEQVFKHKPIPREKFDRLKI